MATNSEASEASEEHKQVSLEDSDTYTPQEQPEKPFTLIGVTTTKDHKPCLLATDGEKEYTKDVTVDELFDLLGKEQVRQLFPSIVSIEDKVYMVSSGQNARIEIELDLDDDDMAKAQAAKYGIIWAQLISFRKLLQQEFTVPEEYRDKYCLIFSGKVFFAADTYEEIAAKKEEAHLDFKVYIPPAKKE